jgi:uncharacterized protein
MRILFELSHPKHYYQFRYLIYHYLKNGDEIKILARNKDVLLNILDEEDLDYTILGAHGKSFTSKFLAVPQLLFNYNRILRSFKPDIIISKASPYALFANPFFRGKTVIAPDSEVVTLTNRFVAPFTDLVITPETFTRDFGSKHKRVDGFFEETYLSPIAFTPDSSILARHGIDATVPYFVLRFIGWSANHDVGQFGFSDLQKIELVDLLLQYGKVYISAEQNSIPDVLSAHLLKIPARDIHHALHFASLYVGDSQTMATESALLGTPSIRFNSFVGPNDMSNFILLEKEYGMLFNFNNFPILLQKLKQMVLDPNLKASMLKKRESYFSEKIDINKQLLNIINH